MTEAELVALFTSEATEAEFLADVPHTRPGHPWWRLLTGRQWDSFLSWNALWDRAEARYGPVAPSLFSPSMRATARRMW